MRSVNSSLMRLRLGITVDTCMGFKEPHYYRSDLAINYLKYDVMVLVLQVHLLHNYLTTKTMTIDCSSLTSYWFLTEGHNLKMYFAALPRHPNSFNFEFAASSYTPSISARQDSIS